MQSLVSELYSVAILLLCFADAPFASAFGLSPTALSLHVLPPLQSSSSIRTPTVLSASGVKQRLTFNSPPSLRNGKGPPKLILIAGCPGTGKSTFGMSLALEQGILKCISTDTVRAVMRSYVPESISPPLHRSSYAPASDDESDDPVKSWIETCKVLESSLEGLVDDAIQRGVSLVLEGVSIRPAAKWIDKFRAAGGTACGVLLTVSNEETHKKLLLRRGFITGNNADEEKKLKNFDRVRLIQDEMIRRAKESGWVLIEQRMDPDPLDVVADELYKATSCEMRGALMDELEEDCEISNFNGGNPFVNELVRANGDGGLYDDSPETVEI
jgi:2-phosphoglycerate kinase